MGTGLEGLRLAAMGIGRQRKSAPENFDGLADKRPSRRPDGCGVCRRLPSRVEIIGNLACATAHPRGVGRNTADQLKGTRRRPYGFSEIWTEAACVIHHG